MCKEKTESVPHEEPPFDTPMPNNVTGTVNGVAPPMRRAPVSAGGILAAYALAGDTRGRAGTMKKTFLGLFLLAVGLFAVVGQGDDKNTVSRILQARDAAQSKLEATLKGAQVHLTVQTILNQAGAQLEGTYVHFGSDLRFVRVDSTGSNPRVSESSTMNGDAFWRAKLSPYVWLHFQFVDGSYIVVISEVSAQDIADLQANLELSKRALLAPVISEGYQDQEVTFHQFEDNFWRLKDPKAIPAFMMQRPISKGSYHGGAKGVTGIVASHLGPPPLQLRYDQRQVERTQSQTRAVRPPRTR